MRLSCFDGGWHGPSIQGNGVFHYLLFKVDDATGGQLQIQVDDGVFWRVNPGDPHPKPETFTERFTLLALGRLGALGRERVDELLAENASHPTYAISIDERDADEVRRLPGERECRYQSTEKGDLYCSVGASSVSKERPMPTTRHLCGSCSLPDGRVACSHLHHAVVGLVPGERPSILRAYCDIGRDEVSQDAGKCRPGGHACWAKEVEFAASEPSAASPLALHESFDYFDALWKNVMKTHLLRLRGAAGPGKLATQCGSAADLEVKLSALADIINSFDITDADLVPAHRENENYAKGRTLARLESALVNRLGGGAMEGEAIPQVKEGVRVLRSAMDLRRGYQHTGSGAAGKLPAAFAAFGLPYPPTAPSAAWARIQAEVLRALEMLREVLRSLD